MPVTIFGPQSTVCCTGWRWHPTQNSASGKDEGHSSPHNCQVSSSLWIWMVTTGISFWQIDFLLISSFSYHQHEKFCYLQSSLWLGAILRWFILGSITSFSLLWMGNLLASLVPHTSCMGEGKNLLPLVSPLWSRHFWDLSPSLCFFSRLRKLILLNYSSLMSQSKGPD